MTTASTVVALARGTVGETEQRTNRTRFGRWYGLDGAPWCAMWVSFIFWSAGLPQPAQSHKGFASCEVGLQWYKRLGTFTRTGRGGFRPGDVVFFQFDKDVAADHVGIIAETAKTSVTTIEGNTSASTKGSQNDGGGVHVRQRPLNLIIGVGRPLYSPSAPHLEPVPAPSTPWPGRLLTLTSPHMRGNDVRQLQARLNRFGGQPISVDGDYGQVTADRVRFWQIAMSLAVDGVVGRETWAAFFR